MPSHTVLIVDDDLDWLQIVSRFLDAHDFHVLTATNGTEALQVLASVPQLTAILLDLQMPIMSGLEFYRRVRRGRRLLRKPLDLNTLLTVLRAL